MVPGIRCKKFLSLSRTVSLEIFEDTFGSIHLESDLPSRVTCWLEGCGNRRSVYALGGLCLGVIGLPDSLGRPGLLCLLLCDQLMV